MNRTLEIVEEMSALHPLLADNENTLRRINAQITRHSFDLIP